MRAMVGVEKHWQLTAIQFFFMRNKQRQKFDDDKNFSGGEYCECAGTAGGGRKSTQAGKCTIPSFSNT